MITKTYEVPDKARVVCRILDEPIIRKGYHIFADNYDEYTLDFEKAYSIYEQMCEEHDNVRLYEFYEEEESQDIWDGDCLEAKGDFPC